MLHHSGLVWFFLVGAACPLAAYLISLRWPNSFVKYVNFPVIFSGTGAIPPATAINYVPWAIVGFIFNYVVRRRHFSWWTKYNCKRVESMHACNTHCIPRRSIRWIGFRCRHIDHRDLLLCAVSARRCYRQEHYPGMVGKHCIVQQCGRTLRELQSLARRWSFWVTLSVSSC